MKMNQKGNDNMMTPGFLYNHLNVMFGFTLDAACDSNNCLAAEGFCYDQGSDGLEKSWLDHVVFCNPPYSQKDYWIKKAHDEVLYGNCPVCNGLAHPQRDNGCLA